MSGSRPALRQLIDLLRAADPGLARGRSALRAVLAAGLAGGATALLLQMTGQELGAIAIAVAIGLLGVLTLPPGPPRLWGPLALVIWSSTSISAALLGEGPAGYAMAMVIATGAAWASRWGLTGSSLGFLAFITSLLSLRSGFGPSDSPALLIAVAIGVGAVLVTVRLLVRENPSATAHRLRRSLLAQLSVLVDALERLAAEGPGGRRQRRARLRLVAVQETALMLDQTLARSAPGLRVAVLDVEALADHLLWSVLTIAPEADPDVRAHAVHALRRGRIERDEENQQTEPLVPRMSGHDDRLDEIMERLSAAARRLRLEAVDVPIWPTLPTVPAPTPSGRLTLKTAMAVVPTLLLGLLIARTEWYWAVIAAYIIITTTASRGESFWKAGERLLGTMIGVVAGIGIAQLLAGNGTVVLAVLIGVVAAMVWVFRVNYTLFTFALTVAIALLYQVTGTLTTQILAQRVAETALGVIIASLVVGLVLPVSTRRTVDDAVSALLRALDDVLAQTQSDGRLSSESVRQIDREVSAVRQVTAPFVSGLPLASSTEGRAARLLSTAIRVRVGALRTATNSTAAGPDNCAEIRPLRARLAELLRHVDGSAAPGAGDLNLSPLPLGETEVGVILRAIDDRLAGYATARGLDLREDPGALAAGSGRRVD